MDTPDLKPGGFWICPACGLRNKVWAPCSSCGTTLAGMAYPEPRLASAGPAPGASLHSTRRRNRWLYAVVAAGVVVAVVVAVALSRLLGGATLTSEDDLAAAGPRAAVTSLAPARTPEPLPPRAPLPAPAPDVLPATPPAAVYAPSLPSEPPGYSIPAPARPAPRGQLVVDERRAGAELRARQQAVRAAEARFARAEDELSAAEGGDPDREMDAMEELDRAARALREAEAALDRARQRAGDTSRRRR